MVEGESGLLAVHPQEFRPLYEPSKRRLTWPNGALATLYNGWAQAAPL
jgi:phage terminase large subunit-like protein